MSEFRLDGRVALVTGAGRGLGLEIAKALAGAGARVALNGRDAAVLARQAAALNEAGLAAVPAAFDIADAAATEAGLARLLESEGRLDILVNNVGLRHRSPIAELTPDAFAALLDVNLVAAYRLGRLAVPHLAAGGGGSIVNITSIAGPRARPGDPAYTAAKGGLEALTRSFAVELGRQGVRCNAIAPGFFATETNAAMVADEAVNRFLGERVPLGRWGRPAEIGPAAVFLASDAASYVNGQVLTVDGGLSVSF